jgi:hypothetical protein
LTTLYVSAEMEIFFSLDTADAFIEADLIGIGAAVACRPLPHHRANGSVHGGSRS